MSAFIGLCLEDGAFLSADSRRTNMDNGNPIETPVKKIHPLNDELVIATGGLGTIGHEAREEVQRMVQQEKILNFEEIIEITRNTFFNAYSESLKKHGNHKIPLFALIAGQNNKGKGIIYTLSSVNEFKGESINQDGQPYFTGSNTNIVVKCASDVYYNFKDKGYPEFYLDEWATLSFACICEKDRMVGFPIQLTIQRNELIQKVINVPGTLNKNDNNFKYKMI